MGNTREIIGATGLAMAKGIFRIVLYVCIAFLIFWAGKVSYEFSYSIFNEKAMSPGEGTEVTVVIEEGANVLKVGKTLQSRGLIDNPYTFVIQEFLSNYHGKMQPGAYTLSTAYLPSRIIGILAGDTDLLGTTENN
ncbi:MAG: solute-binding protein [Clostridiales bacterium]|nr:solute-binding protein [Candidatus Blautia equi]